MPWIWRKDIIKNFAHSNTISKIGPLSAIFRGFIISANQTAPLVQGQRPDRMLSPVTLIHGEGLTHLPSFVAFYSSSADCFNNALRLLSFPGSCILILFNTVFLREKWDFIGIFESMWGIKNSEISRWNLRRLKDITVRCWNTELRTRGGRSCSETEY